jgi:hypothetical protein
MRHTQSHTDGGLSGATPADGCGMQTSTGRLVVPMYGPWSSTCVSDDHGKTWQHSKDILGGLLATEGEITELFPTAKEPQQTLYYTIRTSPESITIFCACRSSSLLSPRLSCYTIRKLCHSFRLQARA